MFQFAHLRHLMFVKLVHLVFEKTQPQAVYFYTSFDQKCNISVFFGTAVKVFLETLLHRGLKTDVVLICQLMFYEALDS